MRVLFLPAPAIGHAFPMVPLAWAFRAAGHDVLFITAGDGLAVAQAGLPVLDALPGRTTNQLYAQFVHDVPELFEPLPEGVDPVAGLNERKPSIVACWDPYVDAHLALAERVRPDLVVYDPIFGVGPLVAATLGIPAAAYGFTLCRYPPEMLRELPAAVAFQRHGLKVPDEIPTIDLAPPSLVEGPPSPLQMRYIPYNGGSVLPDWLLAAPERPRLAVTFGSLEQAHGSGSLARLAAAAAGVDAEFVVASGEANPRRPDELPPNVRIIGWTPLNALLPSCTAAIHHGGSSSALTCCALGIPQLALPENFADAMAEAQLLQARGAAMVLHGEELDAAVVRELLDDDKLRRVAGELKAEIAELPSPADLVPRLVELP
ncbi:MAG TPA: nucleotide disphospho-sugar-binding domain-containing protein [Jatrophihabitans sp.]|jgi:UDP:flavonoid glycosyltransferase YjiC (YdhE family)|nr:nucleotide disphospho-sugar-binding domain-containing protein [Jatrophihabitans sp.]